MGVLATYCQLCGLPVQHDHYVRNPRSPMMKIYRGDQPNGGHEYDDDDDVFTFGPEHAWLLRGVAIPDEASMGPVLRGTCSDGVLEGDHDRPFVGDGADDRYAFHEACWNALGQPSDLSGLTRSQGTFEWALVEPFQHQLFAFTELREQGKGHMLVDPTIEPRTQARIERMAKIARAEVPEPGADVASVLHLDRGWVGMTRSSEKAEVGFVIQYRRDVEPELDRAGYPTLMWLLKPWVEDDVPPTGPQMDAFETFTRALKAAVEEDDAAIVVMIVAGNGQLQYLVYAKDEAATRARIDALPGRDTPLPLEYTNEADPEWRVYFEHMWPRDR